MKFEIYKDKAGKFRWRLRSSNGRILADSGQGYTRKSNAKSGVLLTMRADQFSRCADLT